MAQFRAVIQGMRGEASRLGGKTSGIQASINGWSSGISVNGYFDEKLQTDVFVVTLNEGNGYNRGRTKEIGRFTAADLPDDTRTVEERNNEMKRQEDEANGLDAEGVPASEERYDDVDISSEMRDNRFREPENTDMSQDEEDRLTEAEAEWL
jgi:hypothetical protein